MQLQHLYIKKQPVHSSAPCIYHRIFFYQEAAAFATKHDFGIDDIKEIAKRIAALPKINSNKPRIVAITQGENETVVANGIFANFFNNV